MMTLHPLNPRLFVAGLVLVVVACVGSAWACGCSSPAVRPAEYGAALDACVETAKTIEQSRACRADVARSFGRDAGSVFVRVVAFDNGLDASAEASVPAPASVASAPSPAVPARDDPLDGGADADR